MQPINRAAETKKNRKTKPMKRSNNQKKQRGEIGVAGAISLSLLAVVLILGLTWLGQGNDFFLYKVFAPKYEQVRHDTFKNSQAYNDGMMQELRATQLKYETSSQEHKDALGSVVLHQFASYDEDRLPGDRRAFVQKLRREQMTAPVK